MMSNQRHGIQTKMKMLPKLKLKLTETKTKPKIKPKPITDQTQLNFHPVPRTCNVCSCNLLQLVVQFTYLVIKMTVNVVLQFRLHVVLMWIEHILSTKHISAYQFAKQSPTHSHLVMWHKMHTRTLSSRRIILCHTAFTGKYQIVNNSTASS